MTLKKPPHSIQAAFMRAIDMLGWAEAMEATDLSKERLYQMMNPTSGRPTVEACIALDRALKAHGHEPLMIIYYAEQLGSHMPTAGSHLKRAVEEMRKASLDIEGMPIPSLDEAREMTRDLQAVFSAAAELHKFLVDLNDRALDELREQRRRPFVVSGERSA